MHFVHIHIDESMSAAQRHSIEEALMNRPHVANVMTNERTPHDLLVEYDQHYIHPMDILSNIAYTGLHTDVTHC